MTKTLTQEDVERFWSKVDKRGEDECWNWKAGCFRQGYGEFKAKKTIHRAHRLVYELMNGVILEGLFVCHRCDNPACCNPKHLFLGTHQDNVDDKVLKNRQAKGTKHSLIMSKVAARGERNGNAKLSDELVRQIYNEKGTNRGLAMKYGVGKSTVGYIKSGKMWAHIHTHGAL